MALPLLFYSGFLLANLQFEEQERQVRIAQNEVDSLAARVGQQFRDMTTALNVLGSSPELQTGQLEAYYDRSKAALSESRYFLIGIRADGQQLTYAELVALSNRLARALAAAGVRRGDRVGLYRRKSPASVSLRSARRISMPRAPWPARVARRAIAQRRQRPASPL